MEDTLRERAVKIYGAQFEYCTNFVIGCYVVWGPLPVLYNFTCSALGIEMSLTRGLIIKKNT